VVEFSDSHARRLVIFLSLNAALKCRINPNGRGYTTGSVDNRRLIRADSLHDVTACDSIMVVAHAWSTIS
jgi:hypothetical protein